MIYYRTSRLRSRALRLLLAFLFVFASSHAQDDPPVASLQPEVGQLLPVSSSVETPTAIRI
ncbi:MAG: hypothetical protein ACE10O_05100, partial [Candidatus Acidiferrales bacterium]